MPTVHVRMRSATMAVVAAVVVLLGTAVSGSVATASTTPPPLSIKVSGNHLVDGSAHTVVLHGVNKSGTEYACAQGWGIFDGASDAPSVAAMASWHINAVRIPMNEDCWLGINGVNPAVGGANYQQAIVNYVNLLSSSGIYAILDLSAVDPGTTLAGLDGVQPMPDQDHSPAFWTSVATTFKSNPAVLFDLYNEPWPGNNSDTPAAWTCWRNGGACATTNPGGVPYQAAGIQQLLNKVRATGATNVVMAGGIGFANVLDQWAAHKPTDSAHQLAAAWHNYNGNSGCADVSCWSGLAAEIGNVPLITGEMGFDSQYIEDYMSWADSAGVSYLAWTWDTWGCGGGQALISDYSPGTPCPGWGTDYQAHLLSLTAPTITSASTAAFAPGTAGSFTVTTSGNPTSTLTEKNPLPPGMTFTNNGDGTATLAGTPTTVGTYSLKVVAVNGIEPVAAKTLTVRVGNDIPTSVSPNQVAQGAKAQPVVITGVGFDPSSPASVLVGSVALKSVTVVNSTTIDGNLTIWSGAQTGPRNVKVTQGANSGTCNACLTVTSG